MDAAEEYPSKYLIERAIYRSINDLEHTRFPGKATWCTEVGQAEFADASAVHDGYNLSEVVRRLRVRGGEERPRAGGMRAEDFDGELIDLDFRRRAIDSDGSAPAWRLWLTVVDEARGWRPVEAEVSSAESGRGQGKEEGADHNVVF